PLGFQFSRSPGSGLENENGLALLRVTLGERSRRIAADFLIRVELQQDAGSNGNFQFAQGADREDEERNSGFHIVNAGSVEAAVGSPKGHGTESAEAPDGVGMAERQNPAVLLVAG